MYYIIILVGVLTTLGKASYVPLGISCDQRNDCSQKKCEFGIIASCAYGICVCQTETSKGAVFMKNLNHNIDKYVETHYTDTILRQKRSMGFKRKRPVSFFTKDNTMRLDGTDYKRNKRSTALPRYQELLYTLRQCANKDSLIQHPQLWTSVANALSLHTSIEEDVFFNQWNYLIKPFSNKTMKREAFSQTFPKLPMDDVVSRISTTNAFQRLFWPFNYEVAFMNQKLALLGLTGMVVPSQIQKSTFYAALENIQGLKLPVVERKIVYSFDHKNFVDSLTRFDAFRESISANNSEKHLFSNAERKEIVRKTDAALDLIKETMPELHRAIIQIIASIAFYKAKHEATAGGSMNSAIGVIWLDPSKGTEWTVPFYAEQIIHEYIHTSLYMAELVHGIVNDYRKLANAKVMSSLRLEKRDYDRSFHACYVSTGLIAFHAKAGFRARAKMLGIPINTSIQDLNETNEAKDILSSAGKAMLAAMEDFLTLIRLID